MSKTKKILPELRFPEFKDSGEWDVKTLGEVLIKNSKKNKNQKYSQVESVSNKFGFIKQDEYFENRRVASKDTSNYYVIKKGYFAYNPSRIDVGSLAYKHNDEISIISPLYVSFKANNELINDYFLLSFFNSVTFTKQMIFEGGVRNTLNYENLTQIKIPIPKLPEQQRIAACLSSLDELISAHSQKLELLKAHKKGLMQNLFPQEGEKVPKLRFKEFENSGEWVEKRLGQIGDFIGGGTPDTSIQEYWDGEILWYTPTEVKNDNLRSSIRKITEQGLKNSSAKLLPKGTILITSRATIGDVAITEKECTTNQGFQSLTVNNSEVNTFWFYWILQNKKELIKRASGSTFQEIRKNEITNIPTLSPQKAEQQKIASCLSSLDELIAALAEKIEQLKLHKKGLMQGLFPKTITNYEYSITN